jgi:hypothetical protein
MITIREICVLAMAIPFGYAALRLWQLKNRAETDDKSAGFRPIIGFTRLDGMESLSLLLANQSKGNVWAEDIEIFLSGLKADQQTTEASCHGIQKIRQMVRAGDMLPISLAQVIYNAAGDPQRKYSCILSSVLHYRIGEEWFEKQMENYRIKMIGLTASSIHRERNPVPQFQKRENSADLPSAELKLK